VTSAASHHASGPDHHLAGGVLTVDLGALATNYRALAGRARPAATAAVVKADAYGLGIAQVVPALVKAGCSRFFVALPDEGISVRKAAPDAQIFVLSGVFSAEGAASFREHRLIPVLNSPLDIAIWSSDGWAGSTPLPCAIHVDTGMNRLGLTLEEARGFARENALTQAVNVVLVVSHLACADDPAHQLNARQLESFQEVRALFQGIESSLANSAGIMIDGEFRCELTRAGIALYGGSAIGTIRNPMLPVVTAEARIIQLRRVPAGTPVGYGASAQLSRDSLLAVVGVGYADGYHRSASGAGVALRRAVPQGGHGFVAGRRVPLIGRISMDLTAFDVTEIGTDEISRGHFIELFGPNLSIDEAAAAAGTIAYELLTGLGHRYHRVYVGGEA